MTTASATLAHPLHGARPEAEPAELKSLIKQVLVSLNAPISGSSDPSRSARGNAAALALTRKAPLARPFCSLIVVACIAVLGVAVVAVPADAGGTAGAITGSVYVAATGATVAGVCVYADPLDSGYGSPQVAVGAPYEATTVGDGSYEVNVANAVQYNYVVRFDPSCGGTKTSPYAVQYALGQLDFNSANAVDASRPATGIDAQLVDGFSVSGAVSSQGGAMGAAGTCISADDAAGYAVNSTKTGPDGSYQIGNLPAGTYSVYFDPTCGRTQVNTYAPQYYGAAVAASAAKAVDLQADVSGIDAQLVDGATVSGTVTAPGAANYAGICTYATGPGGTVVEQAVTSAAGTYRFTDLVPQAYTIRFDPTCSTGSGSYFGPQDYPKRLQLSPGESLGEVDGVLPLVYGPPLAITQPSLAGGKVYHGYDQMVSVSGPDTNGYPWQVSGLPRGLSAEEGSSDFGANGIDGDIVGIPQVAGTFTVTVTVSTVGLVPPIVAHKTFKLVVAPATPLVSVLSSGAKVSGKSVPVGLFCTYLACSGDAKLTTKSGVVLANAPYSLGKSTSRVVKLELTPAGSKALTGAKEHPVNEVLTVSVRGGEEVTEALRVS